MSAEFIAITNRYVRSRWSHIGTRFEIYYIRDIHFVQLTIYTRVFLQFRKHPSHLRGSKQSTLLSIPARKRYMGGVGHSNVLTWKFGRPTTWIHIPQRTGIGYHWWNWKWNRKSRKHSRRPDYPGTSRFVERKLGPMPCYLGRWKFALVWGLSQKNHAQVQGTRQPLGPVRRQNEL